MQEGQVELSFSLEGRRLVPGVAPHCLGSHIPKYHPIANTAGQEAQCNSLPGLRGRLVWKQHLVCCLPSATISDKHHSCYGLIVLILQHDPTENTCGHTKAPKTWRSVAFCGVFPANLGGKESANAPCAKSAPMFEQQPSEQSHAFSTKHTQQ